MIAELQEKDLLVEGDLGIELTPNGKILRARVRLNQLRGGVT